MTAVVVGLAHTGGQPLPDILKYGAMVLLAFAIAVYALRKPK
jgi:hypothetical protein